MIQATWNGTVIAKSGKTVIVEGNHYFPPEDVQTHFLRHSDTQTVCPWKGTAHYYDIVIDGRVNRDAAWYYPNPKPAAKQIKDRIAFWHGVHVESLEARSNPGSKVP